LNETLLEQSKKKSIKQILFYFHETEKQIELNLTCDLTISDIKLLLNKKLYDLADPEKELVVFSAERQSMLKNNMTLENIWNRDIFFVSIKSNYNEKASQKFSNFISLRKFKLDRLINLTKSQLKVASLLFNQGMSIINSLLIAELFYSDQSWIYEIIRDNKIEISDLLEYYQLLRGHVMYYNGGGEYMPINKNQQEQAFYEYFKGFNFIEKRVELAGDKMILIYCVYSEC